MKRIIPFLFLAVAFGACQDGPTVPSDGPLLKVDCNDPKFQDHPQCNGEPEPEDLYSPTDLAICDRCDGHARDISKPQVDGMIQVVGWINEFLGWPRIAVVWTGTAENIGDAPPVILNTEGYPGPGSGSPGIALGINDNATSIVGWNYVFDEPRVPVIWIADGNDGWEDGAVLELDGYESGSAVDVNNDNVIVGRLMGAAGTRAVKWSWPSTAPALLSTDANFYSEAIGLNNDGDIAGRIWDASGDQAVLWVFDGGRCNLNPSEDHQSIALRVDERDGKTVLVAGRVTPPGQDMQPAVWTVNVETCVSSHEMIDGAGRAHDVRSVNDSWEAVGVDETGRDVRPIVWLDAGAQSELLHNKTGNAFAISAAGHIVGHRRQKARAIPVLWTRIR